MRFFVREIWKDPDLMHFVLSGALATGRVMHKRKGEPYRLSCPRESFPRKSRREASRDRGRRPHSRGP